MSAALVLAGIALLIASGAPALFGRRAAAVTTPLLLAGALAGLAGCAIGLGGGTPGAIELPWMIPGAAFHVRIDALSAFFAAPVFLLAGAGGLYGERTFPVGKHRAGWVRVFFGLMTGALALVMTSANTILFLVAWEIVAVTAFLLVVTDEGDREVRRAGWTYLVASHIATLALFAAVALLHSFTNGWSFTALPDGAAATSAGRALFWLIVVAFGIKAGAMPFHIWLPGAHASAPSHVSAVMSGVVIKMGIYGLVRVLSLYDAIPAWFGATLLIAGLVSSLLGVALALAQHDLKRLLAYHSVENIGIIVTGLGIGVLAQSRGEMALAFLGYAGALLHVWNHGLFKGLLFLSAGAAIRSAGTREIDRMGGLAKRMPWSAAAFLIGAAAITGLPPLNGFVSEWMLYVAGLRTMTLKSIDGPTLLLVLVLPALALTGALALACFVKAFAAVFLGTARSAHGEDAEEAPRPMLIAMGALAAGCAAIGLFPAALAGLLERVVAAAAPRLAGAGDLLPLLRPLQIAAIALAVAGALAFAAIAFSVRKAVKAPTWDCGYAAPTARMQYTSSSLARGFVTLFDWALAPSVHAPRRFPLFPTRAAFESHVPDPVLDRAVMPLLARAERLFGLARWIQQGRIQLYLLYLGATLLLLLAWAAR
jgi:hydrogenase-4 component B